MLAGFQAANLGLPLGVPSTTLEFEYLFNNDALDTTGNHDATNAGGTFVTDEFGNPLSAIDLGVGDSISADVNWAPPEDVSVFLRLKPNGTPSNDRVMSWRFSAQIFLILRLTAGKIQLLKGNVAGEEQTTNLSVITGGVYQSVSFTLEGDNEAILYLDGLVAASTKTGGVARNPTVGPFTIGKDGSPNSLSAIVDYAAGYNGILTPTEMLAKHNEFIP